MILRSLWSRYKQKRFCKLNGYNCPECICHPWIFDDGAVFRGNRCKYGERREDDGKDA